MNRQIKFRAWDVKENRMILNSTRKISFHGTVDGGNDFFKLMQYTGLLDKKGIEIYEGDILFFNNKKWMVRMNSYGIVCDTVNSTRCNWNITEWANEMKTIGNIYENEDLL